MGLPDNEKVSSGTIMVNLLYSYLPPNYHHHKLSLHTTTLEFCLCDYLHVYTTVVCRFSTGLVTLHYKFGKNGQNACKKTVWSLTGQDVPVYCFLLIRGITKIQT